MNQNNITNYLMTSALIGGTLILAGCADFQTTPKNVDKHFGEAVRHTLADQTMYPEHTQQSQQVWGLDGQKSSGIIRSYRMPATDLRQGKKRESLDIRDEGSGN
jgi:type IV pilus biogenesis protein CpaD/CtpE